MNVFFLLCFLLSEPFVSSIFEFYLVVYRLGLGLVPLLGTWVILSAVWLVQNDLVPSY